MSVASAGDADNTAASVGSASERSAASETTPVPAKPLPVIALPLPQPRDSNRHETCTVARLLGLLTHCTRVTPSGYSLGCLHFCALQYRPQEAWRALAAPVAQKVEHSVFHRGVVGSYPTQSNFSGVDLSFFLSWRALAPRRRRYLGYTQKGGCAQLEGRREREPQLNVPTATRRRVRVCRGDLHKCEQ
jgi:hypothetical protein